MAILRKSVFQGIRHLPPPRPGHKWVVPDGGWGWMVAIGASMINLFYTAGCLSFGIIFNDIVTKLGTTSSVAGWVIGLYYFTSNAMGPLVLSFAVKYTYRLAAIIGAILAFLGFLASSFATSIHVLFFTFGIIAATGTSFALCTSLCVVYPYFDKFKGRATSIALTGFPIGRFIMAPLLQFLHLEYGFQGLLLIVSAMMLNMMQCGLLFHPVTEHMKLVLDEEGEELHNLCQEKSKMDENSELPEMQKFLERKENGSISNLSLKGIRTYAPEMSSTLNVANTEVETKETNLFKKLHNIFFGGINFSILKNPAFYITVVNSFLSMALVTYVFIFLVPLGETKNFTPGQIATIMIATSTGETLGRIAVPTLMDFKIVPAHFIIIGTSAVTASLLWAVILANTYPLAIVICSLLGFFSGGHVGGAYVVGVDVLGVGMWPSASGLSQLFQAFFLLAFGPIIGWAKDTTGSFDVLYLVVSVMAYLTTISWLLLPLAQRFNKRRANTTQHCGK